MQLTEDSLDQYSFELTLINVKAKTQRNLKFQEEIALVDDMEIIQNLILMGLFSQERTLSETISSLAKQQNLKDSETLL